MCSKRNTSAKYLPTQMAPCGAASHVFYGIVIGTYSGSFFDVF